MPYFCGMTYRSINPYTGVLLEDFSNSPLPDLTPISTAYQAWSNLPLAARVAHLGKLRQHLDTHQHRYARLITAEMGKPYRESLYEINKCLTAFDYYLSSAATLLAPLPVSTAATESYVSYEPLGIILSVMPWNFPFWQVFRFAVPSLIAGNVTILKHAPNVPQCARAIAASFLEAGLPDGILSNLYLSNEDTIALISLPAIAGVSFTGSDHTGSLIAAAAGQAIKKSVIELGGNDPFIVLRDADIDMAVAGAIKSRSINSGQSCNAAKRFLIAEEVYDRFLIKLKEGVGALVVGDPMHDTTHIGPLARPDLAEKVRAQIATTVAEGAVPHYHPHRTDIEIGNMVYPVVLEGVLPNMTAWQQEVFGPVWSVTKVTDIAHAVALANQSIYGLGASIWTNDVNATRPYISKLQSGNVFINEIVKSDARLPFGGVKRSGYGRELSPVGLMEFVNIKTVYIQ